MATGADFDGSGVYSPRHDTDGAHEFQSLRAESDLLTENDALRSEIESLREALRSQQRREVSLMSDRQQPSSHPQQTWLGGNTTAFGMPPPDAPTFLGMPPPVDLSRSTTGMNTSVPNGGQRITADTQVPSTSTTSRAPVGNSQSQSVGVTTSQAGPSVLQHQPSVSPGLASGGGLVGSMGSQPIHRAAATPTLLSGSAAVGRQAQGTQGTLVPLPPVVFPPPPAGLAPDTVYLANVLMSQNSRSVPRNIKFPALNPVQVLGNPNNSTKDGMTFHTWLNLMHSSLLASNCVQLATQDPPADLASAEGVWWQQTNAVLFNALCAVVPDNVKGKLAGMVGGLGSFRAALLQIQELYFRPSPYTSFSLMDEINKFSPLPGEDMLTYTSRAQKLGETFQHFGEFLSESSLCLAMFKPLGDTWYDVLSKLPAVPQQWRFEHMCQVLLEEDYRRRLYFRSGSDTARAPLHLQTVKSGFRRSSGNAYAAATQGSPSRGGHSQQCGSAHKAFGDPKSAQKASNSSPKKVYPRSPRPSGGSSPAQSYLLCFHCKNWGHKYPDCPSLPNGWRPSSDRVQECLKQVQQQKKKFRPKGRSSPKASSSPTVTWKKPEVEESS